MNPNKEKGSKFERDLRDHLLFDLGLDVERLRQVGTEDEGDLVVRMDGDYTVIEAKAENRIDLPGYLRELEKEREFFAMHRGLNPDSVNGLVIIKRRMAPMGKCYVVTTVNDYWRTQ